MTVNVWHGNFVFQFNKIVRDGISDACGLFVTTKKIETDRFERLHKLIRLKFLYFSFLMKRCPR